jgi:hypothetical protein
MAGCRENESTDSARGGNIGLSMVMVVAHWFRLIKAVARCQTEQPGVDHQPVRLVETLLSPEGLWTARSPPAIIQPFGAAPPSASVETVQRERFHCPPPSTPIESTYPQMDCGYSLVRVIKPSEHAQLIWLKKQFPTRGNRGRMCPTARGTTEAAVRKRFALSGAVAFALIGVAFALEAFGPISLS